MSDAVAIVCLLFGALFLLGRVDRRHWPRGEGRELQRRALQILGWLCLGLALVAFSLRHGLEVGLAWFVLWLALAALGAVIGLSLSPRASVWIGGIFLASAVVTWAL
ncbi:MAG: DUF3325 family protein [Acidobacteriota bacterium]